MAGRAEAGRPGRRLTLTVAAAGLFLAALDAYVVVTLLPQMLADIQLPISDLQAVAPIISGFLTGYVIGMPLVATLSDARGRFPVMAAALVVFGVGSVVTALSSSIDMLILGRVIQGLGGGALVAPVLGLAADAFPVGGRNLPVGAVSAVQEAGSVFGPLYGALLAVGPIGWRLVFWLNLPLAGLIVWSLWRLRRGPKSAPMEFERLPAALDWLGAALIGGALGLLVLGLYPDDPARRPLNTLATPLLVGAALLAILFVWQQRRRLTPLVPSRVVLSSTFLGALGANLLSGVALMVALVDIPLLARGTFREGTLGAGLLLSRLLFGIPIGAVLGGLLRSGVQGRWGAPAGLLLAAGSFKLMSGWSPTQDLGLGTPSSLELLACGIGLGVAIAPLTSALLDLAPPDRHAVMGSLAVLSRTLGMVVGLSGLTAFGLHRFNQIVATRGCAIRGGGGSLGSRLSAYETCVRGALLLEYREIFALATITCLVAAVLAMISLRGRRTPLAVGGQIRPGGSATPRGRGLWFRSASDN